MNLDVAALQLTSVDDVTENVTQILRQLASLEANPPDLICLPENALYMRIREGGAIPAISLDHPDLLKLVGWADRFKSRIHVGSVPMASGGRLFNTSLLIEPGGRIADVYRKIHLFDVDVAGHKPVRESDVFSAGEQISVLDIGGWKVGCSICYDLRFAELFLKYAQAEVDLILIPSAFLVPTGRAHWDVMIRARAIESQAYVIAAAQGGTHRAFQKESNDEGLPTRGTFGHSMIVDPWGEVVQTLPDDFGDARIIRAELSRERIRQVRAQIPMRNHRRL